MSWPSSVIVDAVFIAVYLILTGLTLFSVIKHGHGKQSGFIYLLVFSVCRLIANILLVYTYNTHYKHSNATTWGFLLQGLGFSFLVSASLGFYARAICKPGEQLMMAGWRDKSRRSERGSGRGGGIVQGLLTGPPRAMLHKVLHLISFIALILLITGYNSSNVFSGNNPSTSSGKFNGSIRAGDLVYVGLTIVIAALCIYRLMQGTRGEQRIILIAMLIALPIMLVRAIFVAYRSFSDHPLQGNLAVKVVLEYVAEVLTLLVYSIMGFYLKRRETKGIANSAQDHEQQQPAPFASNYAQKYEQEPASFAPPTYPPSSGKEFA